MITAPRYPILQTCKFLHIIYVDELSVLASTLSIKRDTVGQCLSEILVSCDVSRIYLTAFFFRNYVWQMYL